MFWIKYVFYCTFAFVKYMVSPKDAFKAMESIMDILLKVNEEYHLWLVKFSAAINLVTYSY